MRVKAEDWAAAAAAFEAFRQGFFQLHQCHAAAVRGTAFDDADGLVAETGVEQQAASVGVETGHLHQRRLVALAGDLFHHFHQVLSYALAARPGRHHQVAKGTELAVLPLVEVGEASDFPIQFHHGTFAPLGDGGGELADVERPDGLGVAEEQFIDVLREADHVTEVGGRGRAVLQVCVQTGWSLFSAVDTARAPG